MLVTEPTPFGLHDLSLAVQLVKKLDIKFGVVVNRFTTEDTEVFTYCSKKNIPIVGKIIDSMEVAKKYSNGKLLYDMQEIACEFENIFSNIINLSGEIK